MSDLVGNLGERFSHNGARLLFDIMSTGPTYAIVDRANHIPNMQTFAVIPVCEQLYSLGRQSILLVSFTVITESKAIIVG